MGMEESTTYQFILRQGEDRAMRGMILQQGELRFGAPREDQLKCLGTIFDRERLWDLVERLFHATSWQELLA